jgi:glutaredoxin
MRRSADTQSRFPSKDFPGTLPRHAADLQISNTRILLETDQEELVMPRSRIGDEDGSDGSGNEGTPETQAKVDGAVGKLALYYYETCGFCARVRATIDQLEIDIELRDIHRDPEHYQRLVAEGGAGTVPCLLIESKDGHDEWLYESGDICDYLEDDFGGRGAT